MSELPFMKAEELLTGEMVGKRVRTRGWIYRTRHKGKMVFTVIRDSSGIIQATLFRGDMESEQDFEDAKKALVESSVEVEGILVEEPRAPGGYEIQVRRFRVIHFAEIFPITKDQSEEFLMDKRHLWVRSRRLTAIAKIKHSLLKAAREWFDSEGFYEVTPPILTGSAAEGGATLFEVKYFGDKAYLSQSAQLYLEALIFSLEKVYSITPSFRAEKSRTRKHLTEFWHLEAEEAWTGLEGNMKIQEELLTHIVHRVAEWNPKELEFLGRDRKELLKVETPFPRYHYSEALDNLRKKGVELEWGDDFGAPEERKLTEDEELPIFVTHWPKEAKAFYMRWDPEDTRVVLNNDMLAPKGYGEIFGASERETDVNHLIERLKAEDASIEDYEWYLDLRRYGSVQHSGFGMGVERVVAWLSNAEHIRETIPFPMTPSRIRP
jgi:asparaginyl-tRNA synthetase